MRSLEKAVQILYWSLIITFFTGGISYDQGPLIPGLVTKILLIGIPTAILFCLVKYYFFPNKTK